MKDLIGEKFGQYEITGLIGRGGMGAVYRARDTKLQRDVALKVLPLDTAQNEELLKRFLREASAAAGLDHPNIIDIYTLDIKDDGAERLYYIAMRYVEGQTLLQLLREQSPLPLERAVKIMEQLADALDYAHQRHIIHRDVKPANIMVGTNDRVTLMDFGIAKAPSKEKLTRVGQVMGTIEYMSPEQFHGKPVDARTDIYALGIILYEMLTGGLPFGSQALLSDPSLFSAPPTPRQYNPQIPAAVEQVILRCLAEFPSARYQTATELVTALRAALGALSALPAPTIALKLVFPNGYEHPLQPGVMRLGRAPDNDTVLEDDRVSRHHAEIHCEAHHGCAIVDLGSANGTYVNGRALRPQVLVALEPGMHINLGPNVTLQVRQDAAPVRTTPSPVWSPGSLDTTRNGDLREAGSPSLLANPTLLIARAATRLDDRQIALGVVGLLLLAVLGVWFGSPLWREIAFVWNNVPLIGLVGALVYAATRRPWVSAAVHTLTALLGGLVLWQRLGIYSGYYSALFFGAVGSGLFVRVWLEFLPKIKPHNADLPWYEAGWLVLMTMLAVAILYGAVNVRELLRVGQWFGAAAIGGIGWFLGDIVHQYVILQMAAKR